MTYRVELIHSEEGYAVACPVDVPAPVPDRTPFKVKSSKLGLPPEWTSGKVEDLLDLLEGPDRRW